MMDEPLLVEFRPDDRAGIVERMVEIARDRNGWINFQPGIDPDDEPPAPSALSGLFTGQGPAVPLATWTPGERRRRGVEPVTIGLQHASGSRAADRLRSQGTPVPDEWVVRSDHSRRGLVIAVPDGTDPDRVLKWLLAAARALTQIPLTGTWRASIYLTK